MLPPMSLAPPNSAVPTTVNRWVEPWNRMLMPVPSVRWCESADFASMTTWSAAVGACPEPSVMSPRRSSSVIQFEPVVSAPAPGMIALPSVPVSKA